jgi:cytoskeleton protein RodZ
MSDDADKAAIGVGGAEAVTAGAMLRAAREKRGLHIAALAASIKVSPRKLEALEADRYAELLDLTFTRALAQTMCRALRIDAEPVLAKLPQTGGKPKVLAVGGSINTPFRDAPGNRDPGEFTLLRKPAFWATLVILLAALALALLPERWMPWRVVGSVQPKVTSAAAESVLVPAPVPSTAPAAAVVLGQPMVSAASAGPAVAAAASAAIETVHSAPPPAIAGSAASVGAPADGLSVRTTAESWVEVQDGRGQTLLSRSVQPGESVGLDGALPLRLTIGNAAVTQLLFRGQPVDLAASTRDNVARLQLP